MEHSTRIKNLMISMKDRPPKVFQRVTYKFNKLIDTVYSNNFKDDLDDSSDNKIRISRQRRFDSSMISDNHISIEDLSDDQFRHHCLEACHLCRNFVIKFKIFNWITKLSNAVLISMIAIISEYHINIQIALALALFGAFSFTLEATADWSKLVEKYAHLHTDFYELSHSKHSNRIEHFEDLVSKYESSFLFIDVFNAHGSVKLRELQSVSFSSIEQL